MIVADGGRAGVKVDSGGGGVAAHLFLLAFSPREPGRSIDHARSALRRRIPPPLSHDDHPRRRGGTRRVTLTPSLALAGMDGRACPRRRTHLIVCLAASPCIRAQANHHRSCRGAGSIVTHFATVRVPSVFACLCPAWARSSLSPMMVSYCSCSISVFRELRNCLWEWGTIAKLRPIADRGCSNHSHPSISYAFQW